MILPWMDADKSGPGRRKNPRGNLSKVIVRITINAGRIRTLPMENPFGKIMPQINANRKIKLEREKLVERAIFCFTSAKAIFF